MLVSLNQLDNKLWMHRYHELYVITDVHFHSNVLLLFTYTILVVVSLREYIKLNMDIKSHLHMLVTITYECVCAMHVLGSEIGFCYTCFSRISG